VAERLVQAQQTAAILTTFNEVDLHAVMDIRNRYRDAFEKKYGARLGFMSFFVKAAVEALQQFPIVNASVDGQDIIYHGYYDIGIAVSSPRGLVVPILKNCDQLSFGEIEKAIVDFGQRAREGGLSYEELSGGTFTITNGGVFGSLLSTPILNPPQSAILGMHKIQDRPMVENGQIVIRPMMYVALSSRRWRIPRGCCCRSDGGPGSDPLPRRQRGQPARDQVRGAQGLGDAAVYRETPHQYLRPGEVDPRALDVDPRHRLRGSGPLHQTPLARPARHGTEQGLPHGIPIRPVPRHHEHRQPEPPVQRVDVDHVEARERDALQQHGLQVVPEPACLDQPGDGPGGIGPVPAHPSAQHAVEPQIGEHGADQVHVAPVSGEEGAVVETDHVAQGAGHGSASSRARRRWAFSVA